MKSPWGQYRKKGKTLMRPYRDGEIMGAVSGCEGKDLIGGWIACDPDNIDDRWFITADYFAANYEPAE